MFSNEEISMIELMTHTRIMSLEQKIILVRRYGGESVSTVNYYIEQKAKCNNLLLKLEGLK
jgi:hypothetical protein